MHIFKLQILLILSNLHLCLIYSFTNLPSKVKQSFSVDKNNKQKRKKQRTFLHSVEENEWLPTLYGDRETEDECISLLSQQIKSQLAEKKTDSSKGENNAGAEITDFQEILIKGKFIDLTCTIKGEEACESLIQNSLQRSKKNPSNSLICGMIIALQSLLIFAMQIALKGNASKLNTHLSSSSYAFTTNMLTNSWNASTEIKKLKYSRDTRAGTAILADLIKKRSAVGAFELCVDLGIYDKHEDVALLRSGFPIRFLDWEEKLCQELDENIHKVVDVDEVLGIRRNLKYLKVFTIDNASTSEVDDGISVEVYYDSDKKLHKRFWIHIADADHYSPRSSPILSIAQRRTTSLYLPTHSMPMFPPNVSVKHMSLSSKKDQKSLSLGVELNEDGSINLDTLEITPSTVTIQYKLTYQEVDEMLEEGVGYNEEWQLGALLQAAKIRREFRISKGSSEGLVKTPIPQGTPFVNTEKEVTISIDVGNNSGVNITASGNSLAAPAAAEPVSNANLIVTECMILAGEAMGKFGILHQLTLPFRCQSPPDWKSRQYEKSMLDSLSGYCAAWYARRFFSPVLISQDPAPHWAMGLDCYVQWTSPIRRYADLQVHAIIKRFLRREKIKDLDLEEIPSSVTPMDLGCELPNFKITQDDLEINIKEGVGLFRASRPLQRQSQLYWMYHFIEQHKNEIFQGIVLGCVDQDRLQYAVYLVELGLEHRYLSEIGELQLGEVKYFRINSVNPRMMNLVLGVVSCDSGDIYYHNR